jgi:hypothetical protein
MDLGLVSEVLIPTELAFREIVRGMGGSHRLGHRPQVSIDLLYLFFAQVRNHVARLPARRRRGRLSTATYRWRM